MGYYNITPFNPTPSSTAYLLSGAFILLNSIPSTLSSIFSPVLDHISQSYSVNVSFSFQEAPNFYEWKKHYYPAGAVGTDAILGNRLLDEKALSKPLPALASALRVAYPTVGLLFNLVSGPGVWNATPPGGLGSMAPAWRKAVVEISTAIFLPLTLLPPKIFHNF